MATKVGEAYYEIYPKLNTAKVNATRAEIGKTLSGDFGSAQETIRAEQAKTDTASAASGVRASTKRKAAVKDEQKSVSGLDAVYRNFSKKLQSDSKNNEGSLHHLATQFRTVGTVVRGLGVGGAVLGSFGALKDIIGAITAAAPIAAAAVVAIPTAIAGAVVEAGVLKLAFSGVGKAIKDGFDPTKVKDFNKDLKKLSPSAQAFVKDITALKKLKLPNVQQAFFGNKLLQDAGKNLLPAAKQIAPGAKGLAAANGGLAGSLLGGLTNKNGISAIKTLISGVTGALVKATPGIARVESGLLTLIKNTSVFGSTFGSKVGSVLNKFGAFLGHINVGKLFSDASIAAQGFLSIGTKLYGILSGIFKVLGGTSQGTAFLKNFGSILGTIDTFVNSGTGQKFLTQLSGTLGTLSQFAGGAVKNALAFLSSAFAGLYPKIAPFVAAVGKLIRDLVPLGPVVGAVASKFLEIGTAVAKYADPALRTIVGFMTSHTGLVTDLALAIGAVALSIKAIGKAQEAIGIIKNLVNGFKLLTGATLAEDAALDANPIGLIIIAIAALSLGIYELIKHFKAISAYFNGEFGTRIAIALAVIVPFIGIPLLIIGHWRGLVTFFKGFWHDILVGFNAVKNFFIKTVPSWFDECRGHIHAAYSHIINDTIDVGHNIEHYWDVFAGFFTKTIPGWITYLRNWFSSSYDKIKARVLLFVQKDIIGTINNIKNFFLVTVPGWITTFRDRNIAVYNTIRDRVKGFVEKDIIGKISSLATFLLKTVPGYFSGMGDNIKKTFDRMLVQAQGFANSLGGMFAKMVSGISTVFSGISGAVEGPVKFLVNNIYDNGIRGFWNKLAGLAGNPLHLPILPDLTFSDSPPKGATPPVWHGLASGGPVSGRGGPRQDNIPILGSVGEFMVNSKAVKKIGVHTLHAINALGLNGGGHRTAPLTLVGDAGDRPIPGVIAAHHLASGGSVGTDRVTSTLQFLQSIAGRVPYVLGADGPSAYDCSSLVGAVWARLVGADPYRRYFTTGTEAGWLLSHGFSRGADPSGFTVGLTNPAEHTVGILAGHRFEAAHTGTRMRFDDGAANALNFSEVFHMNGVSGGAFGHLSGLLGQIQDMKGQMSAYFTNPVSAIINKIPNGPLSSVDKTAAQVQNSAAGTYLQGTLSTAIKAAQAAASAGFGASGGLANTAELLGWISQAGKYTSIPESWIPGILTIIRRESGGNPSAINRSDSNAKAGHPSIGLMQVIKGTFEAYRSHALPDSQYNPVANIVAAVNYIRSRYGSLFNVQQADPHAPAHGYARGTQGAARGWAMVGENGPEMAYFHGGETVLSHPDTKRMMGYAKGTVKIPTLPTGLTNDIRNISTNFIKSATSIKTSVNALENAIKNSALARRRAGSSTLKAISSTGSKLESLSTELAANTASTKSLTTVRSNLQSSVQSKIGGFGDLTALPFDALEKGGAAAQFVPQLKSQLSRAKTYAANIKKVSALGLAPSQIAALASSDDGESIIASLAHASKSNIKSINSYESSISKYSSSAATSVANSVYSKAIANSTAETKKLTAEMKRVANGLESKVAKRLGIHRAGGGFVPSVPGIHGDNVPILATPGELVVPVGGAIPVHVTVQAPDVYIDGVKLAQHEVVKTNNTKVIASLNRRSGK